MRFSEDDILLLLENSLIETSENYSFKKLSNPFLSGNPVVKPTVEKELKGIDFINTQVNCLRKLFVQLSPADKSKCVEYLLTFIEKSRKSALASTAFNTLVHIRFFEKGFKKIVAEYESYIDNDFYIDILRELVDILRNEWNIFTREEVSLMYDWTRKMRTQMRGDSLYRYPLVVIDFLYRQLNIIKTLDLKDRIFVGTNQEINTDEKALKVEFTKYNFPDDLSKTLDKIDFKLSSASDNFDFKDCMGLIRSFSERLFKHIAITMDSKGGSDMDEKSSEQVSKFFVEKKLISQEQGSLLIAFRHFLSNEGVHRLKSRPDDARLSRNMMIELSLYLMLRVNDLTSN